jgi:Cu/Ag efflux pump CusA
VVDKQPGANALATTLEAEAALAEMAPLLPPGSRVHADVFRQASYVQRAVSNLRWALLEGAAIVALTLLVFLADPRACVISAVAIPLSLLTAVLVLVAFGATVNAMTLGGLAIAIGEVVDDAIIDVENVARRLREARAGGGAIDLARLVLDASLEVRSAVVHATLVVAIAFVPLLTMGGLHGKLFAPLGVAYLASIGASLLCAITLTPVLAYLLLDRRGGPRPPTWIARSLDRAYGALLASALDRPRTIVALVAGAVAAALVAASGFGGKLLPDLNEGGFIVQIASLPGTSLGASREMARRLDAALLAIPEVRCVGTAIGRAELSEDTWDVENVESNLPVREDADPEDVSDRIGASLAGLKGVFASQKTYLTERMEEVISGETAAVAVKVYGRDLGALDAWAEKVARAVSAIPGARAVRTSPSRTGPPALRVHVRPDSVRHGLSPGEVAARVAGMLRGVTVGRIPSRGLGAAVVCRLDEDAAREGKEGLERLPVAVPAGGSIPLRSIADVGYEQARPTIAREGGVRRVTVLCDVDDRATDPGRFAEQARSAVAKLGQAPPGVGRIEWSGEDAERHAALADIAIKGLLAFALAFVVLQGALGSARLAALVLTNLPFALVGGLLAVWLSGGVFTLGAYVGFVTIFGIASRNGVLLVAHLDQLVRGGLPWSRDTVMRASLERLLPILMTASVAALGLLPIALGSGRAGNEIELPMAIVIFGGLFTSTALSLLVLPVLALRTGRGANP